MRSEQLYDRSAVSPGRFPPVHGHNPTTWGMDGTARRFRPCLKERGLLVIGHLPHQPTRVRVPSGGQHHISPDSSCGGDRVVPTTARNVARRTYSGGTPVGEWCHSDRSKQPWPSGHLSSGPFAGGGQPSSAALIVTGPDPFRAPLSAQVFGSFSGEVACRAVALDPHDVNTIYAAGAIDPGSNGPLAFPPPVYSTDRGHKWQRVPTPAGLSSPADFVGFTESPHGVTAWFSPAATPWALNPVGRITGEKTGDGGQHWHQVSLACPATGPCAWQVNTFLMDSRDHGQSWHVASFRSNSLHGLAYWGPDQALTLFEPHLFGLPVSQYPLLRSTDGGARWTFVSLPAPPGGWIPVSYAGQAFMAHDGALVAQESDGSGGTTWIELPPGGSHWRRISGSSVPRSAQGQGQ